MVSCVELHKMQSKCPTNIWRVLNGTWVKYNVGLLLTTQAVILTLSQNMYAQEMYGVVQNPVQK